jgi:putative oxidoreductase
MVKIFSNSYLLLIFRVIVGFVFIYAGVEKIIDPEGFARSINNYRLLPFSAVNFFAIILPWIELVAGLLLILGIAVKENSFIITSLLVIFIIAIVISLFRGLNIDCGCFGTDGGSKVGIQKIIENVLLAIGGLLLIYFGGGKITLGAGKEV